MPAIELLCRTALEQSRARTLIINAQSHSLLTQLDNHASKLHLCQHFKPEYDALKSMEMDVSPYLPDCNEPYGLILLYPAKNKQQTLAWMAEAMARLSEHGRLLVSCANNHGAKSYEAALKRLAGNISSSSKSKCRIFSAVKTGDLDPKLSKEWIAAAKPQRLEMHGLISQPGLFSWDRPDRGSELLLEQLPTLSGSGMDLCCGYGLLSEHILKRSQAIELLHLVEADRLALDCASTNCSTWQHKIAGHWLDAAGDTLPGKLDWIICNPPFHTGQVRDIELGQRIIENGCSSLRPGGTIYLVANRKLPYERVLQCELKSAQTLTEQEGFKVIRGVR